VSQYVSWGYFDFRQRDEGFDEGFQSVPVNWRISSGRKRDFFNLLGEITGSWVSLFDGKSLSGWSVRCVEADRGKTFWSVQDGTIVCDSMDATGHDYVWLVSDKEYADFELQLKVRSHGDSPGNSGVQIRSRFDETTSWLDGPQVDLHPPDGWRCGLIYDETRGHQRWIFPSLENWRINPGQGPKQWKWNRDGWNDVVIRCQGTRILTTINGLVIADYDGAGVLDDEFHRMRRVGLNGFIALQLHKNDRLRIAYKDILIRPATR
jgi:hypothetical protein